MSQVLPRNTTEPVALLYLTDAALDPATGIAYDDAGLEVRIRGPDAAGFTLLTLAEGTVGTYLASGWAEVGLGYYELGLPVAHVALGGTTAVDVTLPSGRKLRGVVSLTGVDQPAAILQYDIDPSWVFELPRRTGALIGAKDPLRLQLKTERPRFAFNTRPITDSKPATVDTVAVLNSLGVATEDFAVATNTNANCGVRDYLVMSKVLDAIAAGTYTVRMTFTTLDVSTLVVQGDFIVP